MIIAHPRFMKIKVLIVVILVCIVSIGGLLIYGKEWEKEEGYELSHKATEADSIPVQTAGPSDKGDLLSSESVVCCYVCGEVEKPGVYELSGGCRIVDFIEAAGGFTSSADVNYLNLALRVTDEDKIYVPSIEETTKKPTESIKPSDGMLDINVADVSAFMNLPGIGETKARAIVEYRDKHGSFKKKDDLKKVSGIGESTYANIESYIKV